MRLPAGLWRAIGLLLLIGASAAGQSPESIPHNQDAPPGPALEPEEAMVRMRAPRGFTVELVAAEPDLVNPVAMAFDERGRVWVAESLEYPRLEAGPGRDRIKVLEDTDGDGRADRITLFAEGLNIPSGIALGHGGAWVANAPDLLLLRDTNGDGRADDRQVIVSGFGREDTHELPCALAWGPDGWLYGLNGVFNESRIRHQGREHRFTCALWRVHPRTRQFELFAEGTSNPWGLAFDPEGSAFVSACVIDHLWHLVESGYYHRQAGAYPRFTWKIESIVDHAHQKAAYCGLAYHDSAAYPPEYRGRLFMGNIHGGCINVDRLERSGSTYRAQGDTDFLTANDAWFMPVAQKTGPDGSLYVLDWYDRYHCYQDAMRDAEGIDRGRGRLYRIRYGSTPRAPRFNLAEETDEQLALRLDSDNIYYRETAQRLLGERTARHSQERLERIVGDPQAPRRQRLHALWARLAQGPLGEDFHARLFDADDATLRAFAVRAAGDAPRSSAYGERIRQAFDDPSPDVRLQAVIAARKQLGGQAVPRLVAALRGAGDDPLLPRIVWQNLHPLLEPQADAFVAALESADPAPSSALAEIVPRACERLIAVDPPRVEQAVALTSLACRRQWGAAACLDRWAEALASEQAGIEARALQELKPHVEALASREPSGEDALAAGRLALASGWPSGAPALRRIAADPAAARPLRRGALQALVARDPDGLTLVAAHLDEARDAEWQLELVALLRATDAPQAAQIVLDRYEHLQPAAQTAAIDLLTSRAAWAKALLAAVAERRVPHAALTLNHARMLASSPDAEVAAAVVEHWGVVRTGRDPRREQVVADWLAKLAAVRAEAKRGETHFIKHCSACHRLAGQGFEVGPDISRSGQATFEQLVANVLDPNLTIGAAYRSRTAVTQDGRVVLGLLVEDSPERIVLAVKGGETQAIPREQIAELVVNELSLMPEGLEEQLTIQELADLLAFVRAAAE